MSISSIRAELIESRVIRPRVSSDRLQPLLVDLLTEGVVWLDDEGRASAARDIAQYSPRRREP